MLLPHQSRLSGFTLVELLVGTSLALLIMAGVLSTFAFLGRNLNRLANQQKLETEGRRALAYFAQDARMSTGLIQGTLSGTQTGFTLPSGAGTRRVFYFYNSSASPASTAIDGITVTAPKNSLVRFAESAPASNTGTTLTLTTELLGLNFRYYDSSDNGVTDFTNKLLSIKKVAMDFRSQTGSRNNGTLTAVFPAASPRLTIRNTALLE